jgi:hypothetical protein
MRSQSDGNSKTQSGHHAVNEEARPLEGKTRDYDPLFPTGV